MDKVNELDVNYVDMKAVMTANKDKGIYHRRDSHWNYQGALIGYNTIMDGLGKEQVRHDILLEPCQEEVEHIAKHESKTEDTDLCR